MRTFEGVRQDLRLAVRLLWKSRGVTALSIVSIALGIGLTTGIFSIEDAMLLRPFAVERPDELRSVLSRNDEGRFIGYGWPDYEDMVQAGSAAGEFAAYQRIAFTLTRDGESERVLSQPVTPNYFSLLGVRAALGSASVDDGGGEPVAVLGHGLWMRRFGGDPRLPGQSILLNGKSFVVAGIMPPEFTGLTRGVANDVWISTRALFDVLGRRNERMDRGGHGQFEIVVRLTPGVTDTRLADQLDAAIRGPGKHNPAPRGATATLLERRFAPEWKKQMMVGGGSVIVLGLVLFVACANVAQLRLAQAEARRRELAMRLALGAGGWTVVRQLLVESALIGVGGGALGILLAKGLMIKAAEFLSGGQSFIQYGIRLDYRVLAFSVAATVFAVLLTGLAPARETVRLDVVETLKSEQGSSGMRTGWQKRLLIVGQVAVSVVFFGMAVLSVENLWKTLAIRPAMDPDRKLFLVSVSRGSRGNMGVWVRGFRDRLGGLPGVRGATFARRAPLSGSGGGATLRLEAPGQAPSSVHYNNVGPDYFVVTGARILAGRAIGSSDEQGSTSVAVVSQSFARQVFGGSDPLGQWVSLDGEPRQVVGIAEDGPSIRLHEAPEPYVWVPFAQMPSGDITFIVEAAGDPAQLAVPVRRELKAFDPRAVIWTATSLREHMDRARSHDWMMLTLTSGLGLFGILLTGAGLFGVLQFGVNRRTREFGVRVALGAGPGVIQRLVLGESLRIAAWGVPLGLILLAAAAKYLGSMMPLATPSAPVAYGGGALAATAIAVAAAMLPAYRATRIDPLMALRSE